MRDTVAGGFAADRTRAAERRAEQLLLRLRLHGHLMAPSSPLGEGRAKSRDHRLPLLEIPFPLFLSLFVSPLSALPRAAVPSLARQLRSPFNSVLPSSSSSQNDSTSTVLNRSCARERPLLSRIYLLPVFRKPGIPARFVKPRCDQRGCDCMLHRLISRGGRRARGFFSFSTPCAIPGRMSSHANAS